jgi:hypothetical protein
MAAPALPHVMLRRLSASASTSARDFLQGIRETLAPPPDPRSETSIVHISDKTIHNSWQRFMRKSLDAKRKGKFYLIYLHLLSERSLRSDILTRNRRETQSREGAGKAEPAQCRGKET